MICTRNGYFKLSQDGNEITLSITQLGPDEDRDWNKPITIDMLLHPKEAQFLIGALMSVADRASECEAPKRRRIRRKTRSKEKKES